MRAETPTCDEACCNRRSLIGDVAVVETLRLRALQQPVHAERLLEAFATRANIVPKNSYRIRDPDALPLTLQRVMFNAAQEGRIWVSGRVDLTAGSFRHDCRHGFGSLLLLSSRGRLHGATLIPAVEARQVAH
jgi:hypothetical protein